ncbi:MAG: methylmalonyl-CoA mutase family protein [Nitrososphaerota archaeon]
MYQEWQRVTKGSVQRKPKFVTEDGIEIKMLYLPKEIDDEYIEKLGFPGMQPYTRGVYPTMYRGRAWTMRQYSGYGSANETNKRFRMLLEQGQTGLSIAFDLPTQLGLDPDDERAFYEVGRVGVSVPHWKEMNSIFEGINQSKVSTSMTINATAMEELSMYIVSAEQKGIDANQLEGTVQNDILKEFIARNNYIYPPRQSMRYSADIIQYCARNMPKWNSISISGYHFEEAGATPSQEIAFTIADGIEYVKALLERGVKIDEFAPRLSFFFSARSNMIEQVAKFRAARRIWSKVMEEHFHAKDPRSKMMRFHVQTAGVQMTASQVQVNIIRTAIQALAAILGGAQSLHVNSYDEALGLPTEEAAKLSLRVQQVILHETDVADSVDPLGGSYMLEELTDQLEEEAMKIISSIEKLGGMVKAIEAGYPQKEIEKASYEYQMSVEKGEVKIVGVNIFKEKEDRGVKVLKINKKTREKVIQRVKRYREERDNGEVERRLSKLTDAAEKEDPNNNLFPYVLQCVRAGATIGEISKVFRETWGEWDSNR